MNIYLILGRGGSSRKNIKEFNEKPIIAYSRKSDKDILR